MLRGAQVAVATLTLFLRAQGQAVAPDCVYPGRNFTGDFGDYEDLGGLCQQTFGGAFSVAFTAQWGERRTWGKVVEFGVGPNDRVFMVTIGPEKQLLLAHHTAAGAEYLGAWDTGLEEARRYLVTVSASGHVSVWPGGTGDFQGALGPLASAERSLWVAEEEGVRDVHLWRGEVAWESAARTERSGGTTWTYEPESGLAGLTSFGAAGLGEAEARQRCEVTCDCGGVTCSRETGLCSLRASAQPAWSGTEFSWVKGGSSSFVRVRAADRVLNVAEVQAYDAAGNAVPHHAAHLAPSEGQVADCLDGDLNSYCAWGAHTSLELEYLPGTEIARVRLIGRADCCELENAIVSLVSKPAAYCWEGPPIVRAPYVDGRHRSGYDFWTTPQDAFILELKGAVAAIALAELEATDAAGARIAPSKAVLSQFLIWDGVPRPYSDCIDGDAASMCAAFSSGVPLALEFPAGTEALLSTHLYFSGISRERFVRSVCEHLYNSSNAMLPIESI